MIFYLVHLTKNNIFGNYVYHVMNEINLYMKVLKRKGRPCLSY